LPKRNYQFEKRQKDLDKKRKREEKRQRKLDRAQNRAEEIANHVPDPLETPPQEQQIGCCAPRSSRQVSLRGQRPTSCPQFP